MLYICPLSLSLHTLSLTQFKARTINLLNFGHTAADRCQVQDDTSTKLTILQCLKNKSIKLETLVVIYHFEFETEAFNIPLIL